MKKFDNNINRREFLKKMGTGAAVVAAASCSQGSSPAEETSPEESLGDMTIRTLSNGDGVSLLGYGCMRWPTCTDDDDNEIIDQDMVNSLVDKAISCGVNYFDTAPVYCKGKSERATGVALARYDRSSYFIATKLSNFGGEHTLAEAVDMYHNSLRELQVDYIDYYLLHSVGARRGLSGIEGFNGRFLDNGVLDYFVRERAAGRIRHLGISVHCDEETFEYLMSLHGKYHWDFIQIQMNYVDWHHMDRGANAEYLYRRLYETGIPVVVMEPLLGGSLADLPDYLAAELQEREPQKSLASWAFRFAGTWPGVMTVLSGMTYMEHLEDNLLSFCPLKPLDEGEMALLESVAERYSQFPLIECTGCQYCMPCPYGLDIPGIFKYYNKCLNEGLLREDTGDAEYRRARRAFLQGYNSSVPRLRQAEQCIGCGQCMEACPQHIKISDHMREIDRFAENLRAQWPDKL